MEFRSLSNYGLIIRRAISRSDLGFVVRFAFLLEEGFEQLVIHFSENAASRFKLVIAVW